MKFDKYSPAYLDSFDEPRRRRYGTNVCRYNWHSAGSPGCMPFPMPRLFCSVEYHVLPTSSCCTRWLFMFIVKLFNLLFFVSFATGYIHYSGETKIFTSKCNWRQHCLSASASLPACVSVYLCLSAYRFVCMVLIKVICPHQIAVAGRTAELGERHDSVVWSSDAGCRGKSFNASS